MKGDERRAIALDHSHLDVLVYYVEGYFWFFQLWDEKITTKITNLSQRNLFLVNLPTQITTLPGNKALL